MFEKVNNNNKLQVILMQVYNDESSVTSNNKKCNQININCVVLERNNEYN